MKLMNIVNELLDESEASEEAKRKGLISKGWGRWYNKQGELVAKTVDGKLKYVFHREPEDADGYSSRHGADDITRREPMYVNRAATMAIKAHGNQMYGDKPYEYHLKKVYDNTIRFGGTATSRVAAVLHDTLEDTNLTKDEIEKQFGAKVANIVDLVTNQSTPEETYRRIRTNPEAVFVKLCDRLANVQEGQKNDKYRKEHKLFKSILYTGNEFMGLWYQIEKALGIYGSQT